MAWALDALHRAEGGNAHLDRVTRVSVGEHLEKIAHGRGEFGPRCADAVGYSTGGEVIANCDDGSAAVFGANARRCHGTSLPECVSMVGFDTSLRDYSTNGTFVAARLLNQQAGRVRAHALGLRT
jgi:hypothetical protein